MGYYLLKLFKGVFSFSYLYFMTKVCIFNKFDYPKLHNLTLSRKWELKPKGTSDTQLILLLFVIKVQFFVLMLFSINITLCLMTS